MPRKNHGRDEVFVTLVDGVWRVIANGEQVLETDDPVEALGRVVELEEDHGYIYHGRSPDMVSESSLEAAACRAICMRIGAPA